MSLRYCLSGGETEITSITNIQDNIKYIGIVNKPINVSKLTLLNDSVIINQKKYELYEAPQDSEITFDYSYVHVTGTEYSKQDTLTTINRITDHDKHKIYIVNTKRKLEKIIVFDIRNQTYIDIYIDRTADIKNNLLQIQQKIKTKTYILKLNVEHVYNSNKLSTPTDFIQIFRTSPLVRNSYKTWLYLDTTNEMNKGVQVYHDMPKDQKYKQLIYI